MTSQLSLRTTLAVAASLLLLMPAAATARPAAGPETIDYNGNTGIEIHRGSGDEHRLRGTPASFKTFVRSRLDRLFRDAGSRPRCATSPIVIVSRYHSDGFAQAGEGWYAPCPGGGYAVTYVRTGKKWKAVLGTQEAPFCSDLEWYQIPRFIAGRTCLSDGVLKPRRYRLGGQDRSTAAATVRRLVQIEAPLSLPPRAFATRSVAHRARALVADGAYLSTEECAVGGDGSDTGSHLAVGQPGCLMRASYDDNSYAVVYVVPMVVDARGDFIASDLVALASS